MENITDVLAADAGDHLAVMAKHLSVEYYTAAQKLTGLWFASEDWAWYDETMGKYFYSNRTLIPVIIFGSIIPLYISFFALFLI